MTYSRAVKTRCSQGRKLGLLVMAQAERYKSQGNQALQAKMYSDAVELYTKAIALDPNCEVYFSNRAAAYAAMERFREALDDAQEVVSLKPDWVKGHVRRAVALTGLKKHEEARKAYLKASQLEPANAQIVESMKAAAEMAKKESEKNWEARARPRASLPPPKLLAQCARNLSVPADSVDVVTCCRPMPQNDLWSEDEEEEAPAPAPPAGTKRAAPEAEVSETAPKKRQKKPDAKLMHQLKQSLADSSEGARRLCLAATAKRLRAYALKAALMATPTPRASRRHVASVPHPAVERGRGGRTKDASHPRGAECGLERWRERGRGRRRGERELARRPGARKPCGARRHERLGLKRGAGTRGWASRRICCGNHAGTFLCRVFALPAFARARNC